MAEQLGFTIRKQDIRPLDFILSLIDAFAGDGNCDTQADLHRKFNELTGLHVSYRSWANQAKKDALPAIVNQNRVELNLSEVLQAYRLRWQIELIFKEIKSYSGWHRFNTESVTLVFSLILMSFVVVTLKRYLAHAARANLCESGSIEEISTHKAMKSGTQLFGYVISSLMNAANSLVSCIKKLLDFWGDNAKREHPARDSCSKRTN